MAVLLPVLRKARVVGQALLGRPDALALRRCGLVAPLEVGQARQREEGREALHLLPESPDGTAVLLVPCQLLLELLQGGFGTDVALKLQSQFYPSVNKVGYFLELFFQKSSGRQCWSPQSQPAGSQCTFVTWAGVLVAGNRTGF